MIETIVWCWTNPKVFLFSRRRSEDSNDYSYDGVTGTCANIAIVGECAFCQRFSTGFSTRLQFCCGELLEWQRGQPTKPTTMQLFVEQFVQLFQLQ
jgi:hypothetical protein